VLCSVDIHLGLPLLSLSLKLLVYLPLGFDLRLDIHDGPVGLRWSVEVVGGVGVLVLVPSFTLPSTMTSAGMLLLMVSVC